MVGDNMRFRQYLIEKKQNTPGDVKKAQAVTDKLFKTGELKSKKAPRVGLEAVEKGRPKYLVVNVSDKTDGSKVRKAMEGAGFKFRAANWAFNKMIFEGTT